AEAAVSIPGPAPVAAARVEQARAMLQSGKRTAIMLGGREISGEVTLLASRVGVATGARVLTETFPSRVRRGAGTGVVERLPYLAELAIDSLKDLEQLILVGADNPVSFFAYPGLASEIAPEGCAHMQLAGP